MGCLEKRSQQLDAATLSLKISSFYPTTFSFIVVCAPTSVHNNTTRNPALRKCTSSKRATNLAVDGWMGSCDAASMHAGEPHASLEAVSVRTGWQTQHMAADTSHRN